MQIALRSNTPPRSIWKCILLLPAYRGQMNKAFPLLRHGIVPDSHSNVSAFVMPVPFLIFFFDRSSPYFQFLELFLKQVLATISGLQNMIVFCSLAKQIP